MSVNWIYDVIEDQVLQALEKDEPLPLEFRISLPRDQFKHFIKLGLISEGKPVPPDADELWVRVAGHDIYVVKEVENDEHSR